MYYANKSIRMYRPEIMGSMAIPYSAAQGTVHAVHQAMQMQQQMQQQTQQQMYPDMQPYYSSTGYYEPIVISGDGIYISTISYGTVYNL
ncbi:DUF3947 family protein [Bacillus thuringiensis]|uniref:DUF3947 family protein n=2 Tax=Bacillus TaxID=1386 RepID=UPI000BF2BC2C|nr:DUF3947 family protein [Bacillus thuringiensis]PFA89875.1 hypothetical protein CN400_04895 [Bacillus thuringiensis]